jgi:methyl-accepting chemotaxis protein
MVRAIDDIANDIRTLSAEEKGELLLTLMAELEAPSAGELGALVEELTTSVSSVNQALDSAITRLDKLDETIERGQAEVRQSVRESGEQWPFPI